MNQQKGTKRTSWAAHLLCLCGCLLMTCLVAGGPGFARGNEHAQGDTTDVLAYMGGEADDFILAASPQEADTAEHYVQIVRQYNSQMTAEQKRNCATACLRMGDMCYAKEAYSQAFGFYFLGIRMCEGYQFDDLVGTFYKNIGNIYSIFGDNKLAIGYYEKSLELARANGNTELEMKLLINLTGIYIYDGNLAKAREYQRLMMECPNDGQITYFGHLSSAIIMATEGHYDEAVGQLHVAEAYVRQHDLGSQFLAAIYAELTNVYEDKQNTDSVLHYCELNLELARREKLSSMELKNLRALYMLYKKVGNRAKYEQYREQYFLMADSVMNSKEYNKIKNSYIVYELDKNHKEIASLMQESEEKAMQIEHQRTVLACTIVCLLVFVVMLGVVYAQKKKLKLAYENLFRRNKEMVQAEQANEARRDEYERRIARLEEDNKRLDSQLEQQQQQQQRQPADEQGRPAAPAGGEAKYSSSKVTDEQRDIILQRINKVMRNPENFCDSNFSLDKLSTLVGSNSRYVSQIINETLGKNFRSFISEYRINEAQLRLLDTNNYGNYTIRAIGESVGYKSQANFIDAFRRQTGMLPSIYQKMAQGDA